ncbi:hypothetical protein NODU109028_15615 [Nocardioides dubius]|uniref:Abi-like protein n=1 Tax=Nocardioides dubius TaxID=317019 RepID=A0ABN1U156_9ACTN
MSAAILRDLAHLEVGLRNACNCALEERTGFGSHWTACGDALFSPVMRAKVRDGRKISVDINEKPRRSLRRALAEAGGPSAAPGKVVARLMFGFWRYLSSSAHDVQLWRPYLHHAFPGGTARSDVDERVGVLHVIRNRVAHHEPLLLADLEGMFSATVGLAELIGPRLGAHLLGTSRVPLLIAERPGAAPPATPGRVATPA